ncbi:hypothetical protein XENORESO_003568 [Xenotaenia resolanae]|uniref:Uncharacterized protein n=1 Tax=Xenotaenia resolanae TaxID=208358 RepID=A0ABV0WPP6_9TELE
MILTAFLTGEYSNLSQQQTYKTKLESQSPVVVPVYMQCSTSTAAQISAMIKLWLGTTLVQEGGGFKRCSIYFGGLYTSNSRGHFLSIMCLPKKVLLAKALL